MATTEIDVRTTLPAPPGVVFARLADRASWPEWSGHGRAELVEPAGTDGDRDGDGVGSVWVMHRGRTRARERVVELTPDRRVAYTLVSGLPLTNYRAGFDLAPGANGTEVHWHSEFHARPGTAWIYRFALRRFLQQGLANLGALVAGP